MKEYSNCGFLLLFLFINTYTGDGKWLPLKEGNKLIKSDSYWELDATQQPISKYNGNLKNI